MANGAVTSLVTKNTASDYSLTLDLSHFFIGGVGDGYFAYGASSSGSNPDGQPVGCSVMVARLK